MENVGWTLWIMAQLMWIGALVGHWFIDNKINTIYVLCIAIGLMLTSGRIIDNTKKEN